MGLPLPETPPLWCWQIERILRIPPILTAQRTI